MRKEAENWWVQAEHDFETAKVLYKGERLDAASFYCQQSVEKALKAYALHRKKESPGPVHSLVRLAKFAGVPKEHYRFLRNLSSEYFISRYPDAVEDVPYTLYTKEDVEETIQKTQEVMQWIDTQMRG